MKILLATAALEEIRWATGLALIDGVLTAPALLADEVGSGDPRERLSEICRSTGLAVYASVTSVDGQEIYREGKELARIDDHIVVQVPLIEDAVGAIRRLRADGVRVCATLVYSGAQALLAAKAGASVVATSIEQLELVGQDGAEAVAEMRALFDAHGIECDVLALAPANAARFAACALAGAESVALAPSRLRALLVHPLTDRGLDQFLNDLSRLPRQRVP